MALGTVLPFWPALLFTYLEPLSLVGGFNSAFNDPTTFITDQLPSTSAASSLLPPTTNAIIVSKTLGNVFLLLAALEVLCTGITRDTRVVKGFLFFVAIGDLGHLYASYAVMGPGVFWNTAEYNVMMWGNLGVTAFLHVNRVATLLGVFGRVGR